MLKLFDTNFEIDHIAKNIIQKGSKTFGYQFHWSYCEEHNSKGFQILNQKNPWRTGHTCESISFHNNLEPILIFCFFLLLPGSQIAAAKLQKLLNWQVRMNICLGVAQGLYYLHASSQSRILHRDIKASNILLDKNLNPKIADFGLARPIQDEQSKIITERRAGTL